MISVMWLWSSIFVIVFVLHDIKAQSGSQCSTPNGERAVCQSIYKCPTLLKVVKTTDTKQLQFLKASQCGFDQAPLVCCGTADNYKSTTSTTRLSNPNIPDRKRCGFQETNRIYNGEDAEMDEFPWMVLLQYRNSSGFKRFSCGGALISSRYVLTAAHCVKIPSTSRAGQVYAVRLGEWNTDTDVDCISVGNREICNQESVDIEVESTKVHEGYNMNDFNRRNDVALIRLKKPVTYTSYIRPICLPLRSESSNFGEELYVSGWGQTERLLSSPIKQKLRVALANKSKCTETFSTANVRLVDTQICAGGEAGKDSCKGDSGGPLMRTSPSDTSQWYIEGIVSFGARCGTEGWPGIYTKVSSFLDWIYTNVKS